VAAYVLVVARTTSKTTSHATHATLTRRELNRATLARQMLLAREKTTPLKVIERLVGMQAQIPRPPFVGLWTRLEKFERDDLLRLIHGRDVVRATLMRATIHLMSADDYAELRPVLQGALDASLRSALGARLKTLDIEPLVEEATAIFAEEPRTFSELRALQVKRHPKLDSNAMQLAVRTSLPLVQVPTGATWGWPGNADFALAGEWLGQRASRKKPKTKAFAKEAFPDDAARTLVLRYLAAFGPATVRDAQAWSGHRGLAPAFEALRQELVLFRDERGRELFDLPKAPRPGADVEAPVRLLPEFDNLLLSHFDRTRVLGDIAKSTVFIVARALATFLVDGMVAGSWRLERVKSTAAIVIEPFAPIAKTAQRALAEEADRLVRFLDPDATGYDVHVARPGVTGA
jgi:hypothetical protein